MSHIKHLMEQKVEKEIEDELNNDTSPDKEDIEAESDDSAERGYN